MALFPQAMEEIAVSKFKATCLALLDRVKRTGVPVLVTRKGEPLALVVPPPPPDRRRPWLGALQGTGKIVGDVISPAIPGEEWESLQK